MFLSRKIKILIFLFSIFLIYGALSYEVIAEETSSSVSDNTCIHLFIQNECAPCTSLLSFAEIISDKYNADLRIYNISDNAEATEIYFNLSKYYGIPQTGLPIVFIGETYFVGEERIRENLEMTISSCQVQGCPCPIKQLEKAITQFPQKDDFVLPQELMKFNLIGKEFVVSTASSLPWLTIGLGLIDGINPCTFSVLFFLLTYLLTIGSRRKAIKIGIAFVLTVFFVYLIFMLGILNLISIIGAIHKIKIIVAVVALIAGVIMLKDFFFYGRWVSLEIPAWAKPNIKKLIQKGTLPSAVILGILSSLVELPCTSGIPLVFTTILAQQHITGTPALLYLIAYNVFYVIPLLIVIGLVAFVLLKMEEAESWRLKFRKYMRLVSGIILTFLGIALLFGFM